LLTCFLTVFNTI